ncbi:MAG TPA: hypothetical protein DHW14_01810 [Clostridiales bacterium]|nr:hypothetical protein [Clostridiales bacterium]
MPSMSGRRTSLSSWPRCCGPSSIRHITQQGTPGFKGTGRPQLKDSFVETLPGFFGHLVSERGLRPATIRHYRHHLHRFAAYLVQIGVSQLAELSATLRSAFVAEAWPGRQSEMPVVYCVSSCATRTAKVFCQAT